MIEPGIYPDMTNDDYHGDEDYLSSSKLKSALPERYKAGGSQDALDFGTLVHTVVLEPDNVSHYVILDAHKIAGDNPKTGKPYDAPHMTAKFKAKVAEAAESGLTVVSQDDWTRAQLMAGAIQNHSDARTLLHGGDGTYEESVFVRDDSGVGHKARFDRRIPGQIVDLKSTSAKPGERSLTRAVLDYGYDVSAAHYLEVARMADLDVDKFTLVFVEKVEPYRVTVAHIGAEFLARGRILRALAVERLTNPDAPRYEGSAAPLTLTPPPFERFHDAPAGIPADFTWSIHDYA